MRSNLRLAFALATLVLVPLVVLAWLGQKMATDEEALIRHEVGRLLTSRLMDIDQDVAVLLADRSAELSEQLRSIDLSEGIPTDQLRAMSEEGATVNQFFVLDEEGALVFPVEDHSEEHSLTEAERGFGTRTSQLWTGRDQLAHGMQESVAPLAADARSNPGNSADRSAGALAPNDIGQTEGWYAYYWENGLELIYWQCREDGRTIGVELNRMRLVADVIAALPETTPAPRSGAGRSSAQAANSTAAERMQLVDVRGDVLHQWGEYRPDEDETPEAELRLSTPVEGWTLRYFAPNTDASIVQGSSRSFERWLGLAALALVLLGLAFFLYRESNRRSVEAAQRVNFVSQVSHELKTPLTNIRMYAELLSERVADDGDEKAEHQAQVIVAESQRLSRLIENVLTFAAHQRNEYRQRLSACSPDDLVTDVLNQFEPSLKRSAIEVALSLEATTPAKIDTDAITQVLTNLISNVEKYAVDGGFLEIRTEQKRRHASHPRLRSRSGDRGWGR